MNLTNKFLEYIPGVTAKIRSELDGMVLSREMHSGRTFIFNISQIEYTCPEDVMSSMADEALGWIRDLIEETFAVSVKDVEMKWDISGAELVLGISATFVIPN